MTRLKLTSPGVLLILAVLAAGGIFLLDLFCLRPYTESQKWAALKEEAVRAQHGSELALQAEQNGLVRAATAWAHALAAAGGEAFDLDGADRFLRSTMARTVVEQAWIADAAGNVLGVWHGPNADANLPAGGADDIAEAIAPINADSADPLGGLLRLREGPAVFARCAIADEADPNGARRLYLARRLTPDVLERLGLASGGGLVLICGDRLPGGIRTDHSAAQTIWLTASERLAVAWTVRGPAGRDLGYFQATVPVSHIHRQATTSRRTVLIVLSLSVALSLLVILGTHMLITGPVIRLLTRLQRLESGEGTPQNLARDLHGEPLMLARRLENAFERLAHISKTDELTGLANRRHFEEVLECFYFQARRYNRPLSVIVMDIDFFKALNDAGGHQAGDEMLKKVAGAIEEACRKADLPARFGGDEFAVLLPETAAPDAHAVAQRIGEMIAAQRIVVGSVEMTSTISMGVVDLNAGEMDGPSAMMGLADRALYTAKKRGRSRIIQAHDLNTDAAEEGQSESGRIDVLSSKLAGLDGRFKDLFLLAFDQVMAILQARDPFMADHTRKVQHYAALIAREMELPDRVVKRIEISAVMHDLGMLALPDSILLCPHRLEEEQVKMMRRHPLLSVRIMERMEFLEQEIPAVRYHHERYDGTGYPEGIAGPSIPLTARILAVADVFDAMTSPRTFRKAYGCAEALGEIRRAGGTQFDPTVVSAFMTVADHWGEDLLHVPGLGGSAAFAARDAEPHHATPAWRENTPSGPDRGPLAARPDASAGA